MPCLIVASNRPGAGKSAAIAAILSEAAARGLSTFYLKPVGTAPVVDRGGATDQDAEYLASFASVRSDAAAVCPVPLTPASVEDLSSDSGPDCVERVRREIARAADSADLVVLEGPQDLAQGRSLGLDLTALVQMTGGRVLFLCHPKGSDVPDEVLLASHLLGDALLGALVNDVAPAGLQELREGWSRILEQHGVRVWGFVTHDDSLSSITGADIQEALAGTVVCSEERLHEPIESFMVGAMGRDKALRYFRRRARKAVVTGGDRSDVQLAALETDTRTLVLTGNTLPSALVLSRAEELGVPVIVSPTDTLEAVEKMEALFGRVRIHDPAKVARMRQLLVANVDLDGLFRAMGL